MTVQELLIKHEGLRLKPYRDTVGKLTIGIGRNIDDNGITKDEALYLLNNDIERCKQELRNNISFYAILSDNIKIVLIDLCFNMGITKLLGFKNMILHLRDREWLLASEDLLDSNYTEQVGNRAIELSEMIKNG